MKAPLKKDLENANRSYVVKQLHDPCFDPNWHFHPHYQLFTVLEGTGTRFVGDDIRPFEAGDTVFLGPNIPHLWRSDRAYFESDSALSVRGIVVYFTEDFVGREFLEKPEMYPLRQVLHRAQRGLQLTGTLRERTQTTLQQLLRLEQFDGVLQLLHALNDIAKSPEGQAITSLGYQNNHKESETERMQVVHEYVLKHFREDLSLSEVASLVSMSEAAFCRYFKRRTNKTFFDFVAEIRIGHACRLLLEDQLSITQIAYESGYNTLSHFNRQFKLLKEKTPLAYQRGLQISPETRAP